jgi:hypothetical protein
MKRIIAVTLVAVLGAACAKAGTDDVPVNKASEGAMKASSQAAAGSYAGALEQSAASVQAIQAAQVQAGLAAAGSYVGALEQSAAAVQAIQAAQVKAGLAAAGSYVGALEQSAAAVQAIQAAQVKAALVKAGLTNLSGVALGITTPSETAGTGTASSKPELGVTTPSEIGGSMVDARFDANGKRS